MHQHTHEHTQTLWNRNGLRIKTWSGIVTYCTDKTHTGTFHFHFALKAPSEHSFTVLMRRRLKQQTEGPLCSTSPPQCSRTLRGLKGSMGQGVDGEQRRGKPFLKKKKKKHASSFLLEGSSLCHDITSCDITVMWRLQSHLIHDSCSYAHVAHLHIINLFPAGALRHSHTGLISLAPFHPLVEPSDITGMTQWPKSSWRCDVTGLPHSRSAATMMLLSPKGNLTGPPQVPPDILAASLSLSPSFPCPLPLWYFLFNPHKLTQVESMCVVFIKRPLLSIARSRRWSQSSSDWPGRPRPHSSLNGVTVSVQGGVTLILFCEFNRKSVTS